MILPLQTLIFSLFLALSLLIFPPLSLSSSSSIYDVLRSHGLPIGVFPKGVQDFSFDAASGEFEVGLGRACSAKFENQVHYDFNVTGTLSFGRIEAISGVTAQELFLWFPVKGIRVDIPSSGLIHFDVGVVRKQFSLSLFEIPPDCTDEGPPDFLFRDGRIFAHPEAEDESIKLEYKPVQGLVLKSAS